MDSKILKQSLKEAKEAIKNKKYSDALKLCKAILRDDRTNYMALVLFGAALQETEQRAQAPNAYRKAVEANPNLVLAWQGLVSFYEKEENDEGRAELIAAYRKLASIESEPSRVIDVTNKQAQVAQRLGRIDDCVEALITQQGALKDDMERLSDNWQRIASVLNSAQNLSKQQSIQFEEALSHIVNNTTSVENMENLKRYVRILYKHGKTSMLAEWCTKSQELFQRAEFPLEWVCRAYSESRLSSPEPQLDALMPQTCDKLLQLNESSGIALLAQATYFYKNGKIVEARDILVKASILMPLSGWIWELLSYCHLILHNSEDAEASANLGIKVLKNPTSHSADILKTRLQNNLLVALSNSTQTYKLKEAISKSKQLLVENSSDVLALQCLATACIQLRQFEEATSAIKTLEVNPTKENVAAALICRRLIQEVSPDEASQILRSQLNDVTTLEDNGIISEAWFELGEFYWNKGDVSIALPLILKAAKVDPMYCLPFTRLADYYRLYGNDQDKARRCYQKAFRLNNRCEQAGIGLSDAYRAQGNVEANLEFLTSAATTAGRWAWLRLGLLYLQMGNTEKAINQLLAALRSHPDDSFCWESLGDAYMVRGAYTAAVKSFQRVLELNPQALYPAIQVASIKLMLGQLSEAEEDFKAVLESSHDYIPALKGLGETYLSQAKDFLTRQLNGRARDKSEDALHILTKAAKMQGNLVCVWKLMGDACILPAELTENTTMAVCPSLLGQKMASENLVTINLTQLLQLATRCYCRAMSLNQNNSLSWHDLALSYYKQAIHSKPAEQHGNLEKALSAARKATNLAPANTNHWNLLGVIATHLGLKQVSLAQHAFIRALEVQSSNVQAWSNLGTLYLGLGDVDLAHQAFAAAQRTQPSYVECWIGQALIAELINHSDAMDLFRHSTLLATHTESGIGYAHWVCKTFKQQKVTPASKQAVAVAADELTWYTGHITSNSCSYNLLGLLFERQGLLQSASSMLEKALGVSRNLNETANTDKVRTNLARVLSAQGKHLDAVEHLKALAEPTFHSQCILAHAYFKAEMFQESYTAYESAWHWLAQDDAQKSHILVAMAAMAYKIQGPDGAKTLLFKSAQLQPPSIHGLFASCALGMLHSDLQLSKLVLKELQPFSEDFQHMADIALFQGYTHFLQSQWSESIRGLSKMVHRHPEHAPLWLSLALLLLNLHPHAPVKASAPCAGAALTLGRGSMDISKVQALVSLSHLQASHARASLIEAQRAVFLYPDHSENWAVLVAAVLPRCIFQQNRAQTLWLRGIVGLVRRNQECSSRTLTQWLSNYERKASLLCDQLS